MAGRRNKTIGKTAPVRARRLPHLEEGVARPGASGGQSPCAFAGLPRTSTGKIRKFVLRERAKTL